MNQNWNQEFKQNKKNIMWIVAGLFVLFLMIRYWDRIGGMISSIFFAAAPLFYGCALAYVVNILMSFYEHKVLAKWGVIQKKDGAKRAIAMLLAYLSIIIIIVLVLYLIISEFYSCIATLVVQVSNSISKVDINQWVNNIFPDLNLNLDIQGRLLAAAEQLSNHVNEILDSVATWASSIASIFMNLFVALIFSIYLLAGKEKLGAQVRYVAKLAVKKTAVRKKMNYVLNVFNQSFHKFIVGQSVEACILGSLCAIGMLILRLPYAGMIGTLIGFTALIPILGAYIGTIIGAIMILTVNPIQAVIFLVFILILQQIEGNVIYPKVVGSSIGLPGIWVFASIMVFGGVFGIPGMLLGVPTMAAVYRMLRDYRASRSV